MRCNCHQWCVEHVAEYSFLLKNAGILIRPMNSNFLVTEFENGQNISIERYQKELNRIFELSFDKKYRQLRVQKNTHLIHFHGQVNRTAKILSRHK